MKAAVCILEIVEAAWCPHAFERLVAKLSAPGGFEIDASRWREISELPSATDTVALCAALDSLGFSEAVIKSVDGALGAEWRRDDGAPIGKTRGVKLVPDAEINQPGEAQP